MERESIRDVASLFIPVLAPPLQYFALQYQLPTGVSKTRSYAHMRLDDDKERPVPTDLLHKAHLHCRPNINQKGRTV